MSNPKILIIGAFDTKGEEHAFLRERILENGCEVLTMNIGVMGTTTLFEVDIESWDVASSGGEALAALQELGDQGEAMRTMSYGAAYQAEQLHKDGKIDGIIGMGGEIGTGVISAAMRALPLDVPKVCVSTQIGDAVSSLTMIPAIADVAGLNRVSRTVFTQAAGAICGMVRAEIPAAAEDRPAIVMIIDHDAEDSVTACRKGLEQKGYEVLTLREPGVEPKIKLFADQQLLAGVLDLSVECTDHEIYDGIPRLIVRETDAEFDDAKFSAKAVAMMLELLG